MLMPEDAQHPPQARRRKQACSVIDHHPHVVADAQHAHGVGEIFRRGQHVGQRARVVTHRVQIEEGSAGNVASEKFATTIPVGRRHMPGGVDHHHAGVGQMGEEPVRRDEKSKTIT